jgi:hypothetical protein
MVIETVSKSGRRATRHLLAPTSATMLRAISNTKGITLTHHIPPQYTTKHHSRPLKYNSVAKHMEQCYTVVYLVCIGVKLCP